MLKILKMSGKLEGIGALNTDTTTNPFCQRMQKNKNLICSECYSQKMLTTYRKTCVPVFRHNSDILMKPVRFENLPEIKTKLFRFSAHGELVSEKHYITLCKIAANNEDSKFALWTKRASIVREYPHLTPPNMILIYSNPAKNRPMSRPPKFFDKVFNCLDKSTTEPINCGDKRCVDCRLCYDLSNGVTVINEVIK